jgi:hypothetical protein
MILGSEQESLPSAPGMPKCSRTYAFGSQRRSYFAYADFKARMSPIQSNIESRCEDAHISQARVSHRGLHLTSGRISQEHTSQGRAHLKGGCLQRRVSHRLAPYRRTSYRHVSHKYISLVSLSYGRASRERAPPVDLSRGVHLLSSQSLCPLHLPQSLRPLPLPLP